MALEGGPAGTDLGHDVADEHVRDEVMSVRTGVCGVAIECRARLVGRLEILIVDDALDTAEGQKGFQAAITFWRWLQR